MFVKHTYGKFDGSDRDRQAFFAGHPGYIRLGIQDVRTFNRKLSTEEIRELAEESLNRSVSHSNIDPPSRHSN
jgi:hypothetical protein